MFLQKHKRLFNPQEFSPVRGGTNKLSSLLKRINTPEIKRHQKKNIYLNSRTYLIQNTKKVIKPLFKEDQNIQHHENQREKDASIYRRKDSFSRTQIHLSTRDARRAAAKNFRERIWKSSDITPLLKAQEQKIITSKRTSKQQILDQDGQKIKRYHDYLDKMENSNNFQEKQQLQKDWFKNNISFTNSSHKNPERLQITNIQFKEYLEQMSPTRLLINRERRKQIRRSYVGSFSRPEKRPNTTGGFNRERPDDNIIEPW